MRRVLGIILLAALVFAVMSLPVAAEDYDFGIKPGQKMPDFTVELTDGTTATLSELLKTKELVVLNIFASWCGPCKREFPEMEAVYQDNRSKMEIVAVSKYKDDTMKIVEDYKATNKLSFPMGLAGNALDFIKIPGYPTTVFVDRNGTIGYIQAGAFTSREEFELRVKYFLASDYNGTPVGVAEEEFEPTILILPSMIILAVITLIARWCIFHKAGKKGWLSLIPFLNGYTEYSVCWMGWIGIIPVLTNLFYIIFTPLMCEYYVFSTIVVLIGYLIAIPECYKLARAFGKGKVYGILMAFPVVREILKLVIGVSSAKYIKS